MPSTTSSSLDRLFASSAVITPSLPTFSMARASMSPISFSPLAEMVPTWAISALVETCRERDFSSLITASTASSMPRFRSIGFIPAATALAPSRTIAVASLVRGLRGDLAQHLRAHVLELVGELDLLGDGHAVLGDARRAEALFQDDVAALRPQRHLHRIGEDINAVQHPLAGVGTKLYFFSSHCLRSPRAGVALTFR